MSSSWWMQKYGAELVHQGYRILPIVPHEKRPGQYRLGRWQGYGEWSRHCERDTTQVEVDAWSRWPEAGIGIACGNVVAVDIDVTDPAVADAVEDLARQRLGPTPLVRTGLPPKRILVYRTMAPIRGLKRPPLELLGLGQQFVAHGFHPVTGNAYKWRDEEPCEVPREDLPAVDETGLRAFLDEADALVPGDQKPERLCGDARGPLGPRTVDELRGTRRAIELALQHVRNADVAYDDWIRVGHALKGALGEGGRDLWHAWSATSAKNQPAETDRAWGSFKTVRSGAGSIYRWAMEAGWLAPPDVILSGRVQELIDLEATVGHPAAGLLAALQARPAPVEVVASPRTGDALLDAVQGAIGAVAAPAEDSLLAVDGLVGDIAAWITRTAPVPQPWLALGAALAAVGVLMARRYAGPTGLRSNINIIAVAPSGAGKDHARASVTELFHVAGLGNYLGGSEIASPQGLLTALSSHAARLYQLDEFGHWLSTTIGARAPGHRHALGKLITELFSTSAGTYLGTDYADGKTKPRQPIHQPTACWYCTTTGDQLWSALFTGAVEDGFLARWLLFATEQRGRRAIDEVGIQVPPPELVERCRVVTKGPLLVDYGGDMALHMGGLTRPIVPRIAWTADAQQEDERLDQRVEGLAAEAAVAGRPRVLAILGRTRELALKLATIRAVGRDPHVPEMTGADLAWARGVVEHCQTALLAALERHVGESDYERHAKRVLESLRTMGEAGIDRSRMTRVMQHVPRRMRDDILRDLLERGAVVMRQVPSSMGRATERFWLCGQEPPATALPVAVTS